MIVGPNRPQQPYGESPLIDIATQFDQCIEASAMIQRDAFPQLTTRPDTLADPTP
jgi:hypothetical protein